MVNPPIGGFFFVMHNNNFVLFKIKELKRFWLFILFAGIVFAVHAPAFKNTFTKWDDYQYIFENPFLNNISFDNIFGLFTNYFEGNYTPLTFFTFLLEKNLIGEKATVFIVTNIMFHVLNVFLVFKLVEKLFNNYSFSFSVALLFSVTPLHVESVVWIAERKDVLYVFLFLASSLCYLRFLATEKILWIAFSVLLFLLSSLSKSTAITLLPVLFLFDYFLNRTVFSIKNILYKLPFFVIATGIVYIGLKGVQSGAENLSDYHLSLPQRIIMAFYAINNYVLKFLFPYNLSAYYSYPFVPSSQIPVMVIGVAFLFMTALAFVLYFFKKNKTILFLAMFFLATLFPALQFFPVGNAYMADRFVYLPSLALCVLFCLLIVTIKKWGKVIYIVFLVVGSITTVKRTMVWKNTETLWSDVIKSDRPPALAYLNRGLYYYENSLPDKAMSDLNHALLADSTYSRAFYNRGLLYFSMEDYRQAYSDFYWAVKYDSLNENYLFNKAMSASLSNYLDVAFNDYSRLLAMYPGNSDAWSERAVVLYKIGSKENAITDLTKAVQLNPGDEQAFARRAMIKLELGDTLGACSDFKLARELGGNEVDAPIEMYCK